MKYSVVMRWCFDVEGEYMPNENIAQQAVEQITEESLRGLCQRLVLQDNNLFTITLSDEHIEVTPNERNSRS